MSGSLASGAAPKSVRRKPAAAAMAEEKRFIEWRYHLMAWQQHHRRKL